MKKFFGFCGNEPGSRPICWHPAFTTDEDGFFIQCSDRIFKETDTEGLKLFGDIAVCGDTGNQFLLRVASAIRKGRIESAFLGVHGTWAFAALDSRRRRVVLGRDSSDHKQMYFAQIPDGFVFGTRFLEVAKAAGAQEYNWGALAGYQGTHPNVEFGEEMPLKGVFRLLPGHYLIWERGAYKQIRWWDPLEHLPVVPKGIKRQSEELLRLLSCSLKRHVDAIDGPIGFTVSGGIDSPSLFALLMQDESLRERVHPFSVTNPGSPTDEAPFVSDLMKMYGHSVEWVRPTMPWSDVYNALRDFLTMIEVPVGYPRRYAQLGLYVAVKKAGINNVIGGAGADGAFGGLGYNQTAAFHDLLRQKRYIAAFHVYEGVYVGPGTGSALKDRIHLIEGFSRRSGLAWTRPIIRAVRILRACKSLLHSVVSRTRKSRVPNRAHVSKAGTSDTATSNLFQIAKVRFSDFLAVNSGSTPPVPPKIFRDSLLFSHSDAFCREQEKVILASGIDSHQPMDDWEIQTFGLALPITSLENHRSKYIIRYAMRDKLPQSILTKRFKSVLQGPTDDWLNDPAVRSEITDMINDRSFAECPLIKGEEFRSAWMASSEKRLRQHIFIWQALNLFIWHGIIQGSLVSTFEYYNTENDSP